jgi:hypothetical protein
MAKPVEQQYFVGLDLGQSSDPTALAVLERPRVEPGAPPGMRRPPYALRHLQRFPPGTPYQEIIETVRQLLRTPPLPGADLVGDTTGVGRAVVSLSPSARRRLVRRLTRGAGATTGEAGCGTLSCEIVAGDVVFAIGESPWFEGRSSQCSGGAKARVSSYSSWDPRGGQEIA